MNQRGLLQSVQAAGSEPEPQVVSQEIEEFGLDIFTGAIPNSVKEPATGTHLVHIPLSLKPYDGGVYLETPASSTARASGTPGYYRLTRLGDVVHQGTCGAYQRDELRFPMVIYAKGLVTIDTFSIRRI